MTQCVSATIEISDRVRVPISAEKRMELERGRKKSLRRRQMQCNSKLSRNRCDSKLKRF